MTLTRVREVIRESELFDAYKSDPAVVALQQSARRDRRPCACMGVVEADPQDPAPGVQVHQQTRQHRRWREARGL